MLCVSSSYNNATTAFGLLDLKELTRQGPLPCWQLYTTDSYMMRWYASTSESVNNWRISEATRFLPECSLQLDLFTFLVQYILLLHWIINSTLQNETYSLLNHQPNLEEWDRLLLSLLSLLSNIRIFQHRLRHSSLFSPSCGPNTGKHTRRAPVSAPAILVLEDEKLILETESLGNDKEKASRYLFCRARFRSCKCFL